MITTYDIAHLLTGFSFALPVLYFLWRKKALRPFSFRLFAQSFNRAFIVQLLLAIFYLALMVYLEKEIYAKRPGTDLSDILMHAGTTYATVGAYLYFPGLAVLNLVNYLLQQSKRKG